MDKYKNSLIYVVLSLMLISKIFAGLLLVFYIFPTIEGHIVEVTMTWATLYELFYLLASTLFIVGLLFRKRAFYIALIVLFLMNLLVHAIAGFSIYQSVYDPVLFIILTLLIFYVRPNHWREAMFAESGPRAK